MALDQVKEHRGVPAVRGVREPYPPGEGDADGDPVLLQERPGVPPMRPSVQQCEIRSVSSLVVLFIENQRIRRSPRAAVATPRTTGCGHRRPGTPGPQGRLPTGGCCPGCRNRKVFALDREDDPEPAGGRSGEPGLVTDVRAGVPPEPGRHHPDGSIPGRDSISIITLKGNITQYR